MSDRTGTRRVDTAPRSRWRAGPSARRGGQTMRGSVKIAGTAALAALTLCGAQPAAQARDGIGAGGAAALGLLGGVVAGSAIASANNGYYPGRPGLRRPAASRGSATSSGAPTSIRTGTTTSAALRSASRPTTSGPCYPSRTLLASTVSARIACGADTGEEVSHETSRHQPPNIAHR